MNALRLFGKDLTLLRRSPLLVALLVGYPLLVALLVAAALQSGERKPSVAFVNLDRSGRTVLVGERRISVEQYARRLASEVDLKRLGPAEARKALDDGRVSAGPGSITWNGRNDSGRALPPGTYFAKLTMEGRSTGRKILMLR